MEIDVATRELIKFAVLPPGILIIALLLGWLFARHLFGRLLLLTAILTFYALSTPVGLNWLAAKVETIPPPSAAQIAASRADVILVLLAGVERHNPELSGADRLSADSLERVDYALALHRRTGLPIVVSGGSVSGDTTPVAELAARWLDDRAGVKARAIESGSRDTWENARNSQALLAANGLHKALLVTHAYHMPRALLSARAANLQVVAAPFGFMHVPDDLSEPTRLADWLPHRGYLGSSYLVLHEVIGIAWYSLAR